MGCNIIFERYSKQMLLTDEIFINVCAMLIYQRPLDQMLHNRQETPDMKSLLLYWCFRENILLKFIVLFLGSAIIHIHNVEL